MSTRVVRVGLVRTELSTRTPFKCGVATMTHQPHVVVEPESAIDGVWVPGIASNHLPPRGVTKDPERAFALRTARSIAWTSRTSTARTARGEQGSVDALYVFPPKHIVRLTPAP
jgi:hypothetical protein